MKTFVLYRPIFCLSASVGIYIAVVPMAVAIVWRLPIIWFLAAVATTTGMAVLVRCRNTTWFELEEAVTVGSRYLPPALIIHRGAQEEFMVLNQLQSYIAYRPLWWRWCNACHLTLVFADGSQFELGAIGDARRSLMCLQAVLRTKPMQIQLPDWNMWVDA